MSSSALIDKAIKDVDKTPADVIKNMEIAANGSLRHLHHSLSINYGDKPNTQSTTITNVHCNRSKQILCIIHKTDQKNTLRLYDFNANERGYFDFEHDLATNVLFAQNRNLDAHDAKMVRLNYGFNWNVPTPEVVG
jgi:hypothetical protein